LAGDCAASAKEDEMTIAAIKTASEVRIGGASLLSQIKRRRQSSKGFLWTTSRGKKSVSTSGTPGGRISATEFELGKSSPRARTPGGRLPSWALPSSSTSITEVCSHFPDFRALKPIPVQYLQGNARASLFTGYPPVSSTIAGTFRSSPDAVS
jgi:hypothetical protein